MLALPLRKCAGRNSLSQVLTRRSNEYDQELDSVLVGPLPIGVNKFVFRADPPDLSRIPNSEIIGVTVILLSCSYEDREFVRVHRRGTRAGATSKARH
jgi:histone chaperone ASF1